MTDLFEDIMWSWLGAFCFVVGAAKFYCNGTGISEVFRWYHPVFWLLLLYAAPLCALAGEPLFDILPLRPDPYFRKHKKEICWVPWQPWHVVVGYTKTLRDKKRRSDWLKH